MPTAFAQRPLSLAKLALGALRALALAAAAAAPLAAAAAFVVDDIRIEGLRRLSPANVFVDLPIEVGDAVDERALRDALHALFSSGNFDDIRFARDGDVLVVSVEERPFIAKIEIEGNKAIKTEDLLDGFKSAGLAVGQALKRAALTSVTSELRRQYSVQGRYDADVSVDVVASAGNQVSVRIEIDEGSASRIQAIGFIGNEAYDDATLLKQFELRARRRFPPWQSGRSKYSGSALQGDLDRLESWYLDRGFLRFSIDSVQVSLSPGYDSVYITISVSEGERYTVSDVSLLGDLVLSEAQLRPYLLAANGQVFSRAAVTASEERITQRLGVAGYHYAEARGVPEIEDETRSVRLRFYVDPGQRTYVRRIEFVGNSYTNDDVLRREMRQLESGLASLARIEQSKTRLERLGFFRSVEFEAAPVPGNEDMIDLLFTVEEQPSASISASLGYAQSQGLVLGAALDQANFLGTGRRLGFQARDSSLEDSYSISLFNPYYTPDGVSRRLSLRYRQLDFSEINITNYATNTFAGSIGFGYPINETTRLSFGMSAENTKLVVGAFAAKEVVFSPLPISGATRFYRAGSTGTAEVDDAMLAPTTAGFIDEHGNELNTLSLNAGWSQFRLDRGQLATRGYSQQLSLDVSAPLGEFQYYRLLYDGQYFLPFGDSGFTLRMHTRLGFGDGYGKTQRLPFFQNFYLGGYNTLRGFRQSSLGPRSSPAQVYLTSRETEIAAQIAALAGVAPEDPCGPSGLCYQALGDDDASARLAVSNLTGSTVIGGNLLALANLELLLPLPFLPDRRSVRAALFLDAGNVFSTDCLESSPRCYKPDLDELRYSVGFGFTWLTYIGALTFSWAKPYNTDSLDRTEFFQFNIGSGFDY